MPACVPEYSACTASSACCAPHRCFRQSQFFAQCGRACPREPSWECHTERMRRVGVILSRWGSWPAWTPLLMHTLRANAKVEFLLVTDVRPAGTLPPNVAVHNVSLDGLLARARATVGSRLVSLGGTDGGKFASGVSANKVNDLKPMYGEIFADLLAEFGWWGHLQEDVVLGDLLALLPPDVRDGYDVATPAAAPNATGGVRPRGVFMLYRNAESVNRLWRTAATAERVLATPQYLAFDEGGWGALRGHDSLATVLAREAAAGRIRAWHAPGGALAADKLPGVLEPDHWMVACWRRGVLLVNPPPQHARRCVLEGAAAPSTPPPAAAILHLAFSKHRPPLSRLPLRHEQIDGAAAFVLTSDGLWLPGAERWTLVSGAAPHSAVGVVVDGAELAAYLERVVAYAEALRRSKARLPPKPARPCAVGCAGRAMEAVCNARLAAVAIGRCAARTRS